MPSRVSEAPPEGAVLWRPTTTVSTRHRQLPPPNMLLVRGCGDAAGHQPSSGLGTPVITALAYRDAMSAATVRSPWRRRRDTNIMQHMQNFKEHNLVSQMTTGQGISMLRPSDARHPMAAYQPGTVFSAPYHVASGGDFVVDALDPNLTRARSDQYTANSGSLLWSTSLTAPTALACPSTPTAAPAWTAWPAATSGVSVRGLRPPPRRLPLRLFPRGKSARRHLVLPQTPSSSAGGVTSWLPGPPST